MDTVTRQLQNNLTQQAQAQAGRALPVATERYYYYYAGQQPAIVMPRALRRRWMD
jgi:hypothetical protein